MLFFAAAAELRWVTARMLNPLTVKGIETLLSRIGKATPLTKRRRSTLRKRSRITTPHPEVRVLR